MEAKIVKNDDGTFNWNNISLDQIYSLIFALGFQDNEQYHFDNISQDCFDILNEAIYSEKKER